ncbi:MAG: type II toxin-antitoxin system prevent-host-death family antitoxin [Deferrisomatales bacterium]|nr:type II toxin-antitoxin system prevent-host-death family antitoxin [Deferrisomatales bacterium]
MEVSVRELKVHLSRYLRLVQSGEAVVITSHAKPVARLEPAGAPAAEDVSARLARAPGVVWSGGKPQGARVALRPGSGTASTAVLEDRR